jgi:type III restriction enzyme
VRYVSAADIQDDAALKVVFFKLSLTTGSDCPRAEVMMSFRRQVDPTVIAQLVGRMVRTPLARHVGGSEFLNTVALYLPEYDREALDEVVSYLTDPDPELSLPTQVQYGADLVTYKRNPDTKQAFDLAAKLPIVRVEKVSKQSNVRRLLRFGRLLAWDKLDKNAPATFRKALVAVLDAERKKVASKKDFKERLQQAAVIDVRGATYKYGETDLAAEETTQLTAVTQNIEHAFAEAGRRLGGGLHADYLQTRAAAAQAPSVSEIKLELYALLQDADVLKRVNEKAGQLLTAADNKHRAAVQKLPDERRQLYRQVRRQSVTPEAEDWELPPSIDAPKNGAKKYTKHLYAGRDKKFPAKLNGWEDEVISEAIKDPKVVGWLRNDPRKLWSFSVSYKKGSDDRPMYPDFLIFRKQGSGIVCDIIEPHALAFEDSVGKAKGLADFARLHGDDFGRIELIAKLGKNMKRLALNEPETRDTILALSTSDELKKRFEEVADAIARPACPVAPGHVALAAVRAPPGHSCRTARALGWATRDRRGQNCSEAADTIERMFTSTVT